MDRTDSSAAKNDDVVSDTSRLVDVRESGRELVSSERVWSGPIFAVDADHVRLGPGQEPVARQVVVHHDAVAVVALRAGEDSSQGDGAPEILMVRQYRHPVNASLWEIPAGLLDIPGEDSLVAAERELAEEADLKAARWDVLVDFFTSPGGSTEPLRVFLARDLETTETSFEREDEEATMEYAWVSLSDALDWVLAGRLHNPSTVIGILSAHAARGRGWEGLREPGAPWLR